jgi:16S rRNA (guanine966-N2)-methyltransferase
VPRGLRVVAGAYKGRRLHSAKGRRTRPTADRVREAVFSILGDVARVRVLDLFAGSGALAIEALSRGAASAVLVERDPAAFEAIRRNLEEVGADALVRRRDALDYLRSEAAGRDGPFDLVFVDPPYDLAPRLADPLARRLQPVLAQEPRIVTESDKRSPLELPFPLLRERVYGDTRIALHSGP